MRHCDCDCEPSVTRRALNVFEHEIANLSISHALKAKLIAEIIISIAGGCNGLRSINLDNGYNNEYLDVKKGKGD